MELLNITDRDIFDNSNDYNEYIKDLICVEVYNQYCKQQIKIKNNIYIDNNIINNICNGKGEKREKREICKNNKRKTNQTKKNKKN